MSIASRIAPTEFESPAQEAMVSLTVVAAHLLRDLEQVCAARGITHEQYDVLRILRGAGPEGLPRYAIVDRLVDRSPDVTRLLDRLERESLVERYRSDADRRLSISRVTQKGLALLRDLDPDILAVHERLAAGLKKKEVRKLAAICGKILGR